MAKLTPDMKGKLEYLFADENKVEFIETFIKIVNKQGKLVPFILTDEQKYFVNNICKENIILKSRQLGLSSVVIALSIRECVINPYSVNALVSHSQQSTNSIFDKLKQQYNSLPDFIKPKTIANNRMELKFTNGSKITCSTAGNKELFRGETINGVCHLSELAYYKTAEQQLASLSQSISSSATVIIESTARGFNKFSEMYFQAKDNEISYKSFFFNWINGKTLFLDEYKKAVNTYKSQKGKLLTQDELTTDEVILQDMGANLDQLMWRRTKIAQHGEQTFNVEYPSTDMECFVTSNSASVFDSSKVADAQKRLILDNVKPLSKHNIVDIKPLLKTYIGTSLFVYKLPIPDAKYFIGVDVAEGLGGKRDASVIVILDEDANEVCSFRNNKLKPYQFTEIVLELAKYYSNGHLIIEKASGGHTVISKLYNEYKYRNMHKYMSYDELRKTSIPTVGFDSNSKTKPMIVNDCVEWFETNLVTVNSKWLLEEMKTYQRDENGKLNATIGSHDDGVISLSLAIMGVKKRTYYRI